MADFCFYVLYRAGSALLAALPLGMLFRLGQLGGFAAWLVLPGYRRLAFRNASIAFATERTPKEIRRLVRRHFQQLGANLLSTIKLAVMPIEQIEQRVTIGDLDVIHRSLRRGVPVVLILSHLGNWELCAQLLPKFIGYVRNSTIYQRLGNKWIDEHVRRLRGRAGVELFDRKEGFQKAVQLLRGGGAIGILSDQHAGDQGLWVPFFGRLASTSSLPALLAKRTSATLVGVAFYTNGIGRWKVVFESPLETKNQSVEAITASTNDMIAAQIRRAPEDWFWVHNRWKTPRPNFLLSRYKRGVYVPPGLTLKPFRILIRTSNWLGDAVMSTPAVRAIKRGRPDAHVTVATPARIAPVWKLIPEIDEVVSLPHKSMWATVRALRKQSPFDVAVLFPNSLRVALEAWLTGVPRRAGCRGHWRAWLLNQVVRRRDQPDPFEHHSAHYLRIAQELGADIEKDKSAATGLRSPPAKPALTERPRLGLCPGAEYGPAKRWLPERFAEVARAIAEKHEVDWVLLGTEKDKVLAGQIADAIGNGCINRVGQTDLEQLMDELGRCRLLLTNDTGTMHLAALLQVPTIAIFGSTEPRRTGPLGTGHVILRHQVECSPCFLRQCPIDFRCMKAIDVPEVRKAVLAVLGKSISD